MERRFIVAAFLSFLVIYGYQVLFVPPAPPQQTASAKPDVPASPAQGTVKPAQAAPPVTDAPAAVTSEPAERQVVVNTPEVEAVFSNRGGRVISWRLKSFREGDGKPVDLVPSRLPADQPTPFSLRVDDEGLTGRINGSLYRVSGDSGGRLEVSGSPKTLTFEFQDAAGLRVTKTFRFEPRHYVVSFTAAVVNGGQTLNPAVQWGPGLGDFGARSAGGSFFTGNYVQPPQAIYYRDGDVERVAAADLAAQPTHEGQFRFVGVDDHYFIAAVVSPGQVRADYRVITLPWSGVEQRQLVSQTLRFQQPPTNVRFFYGPKSFDVLQAVDQEFVRAIHFGIFAWLAVPLLDALQWIHGYVGNWGWAIIILTILINIAIFPLRHKSVVSMRRMQELQPQLKAIQDRYAGLKVTDPARQKMNGEIMALYRERGVNPASGCVPMLLTLPVLFAFYSLLSQAIELRGAEFGGWIHDLSQHDPLYITPVLMGASMFWQQKITPTTADPTQQRIMMIMPLMFSFMFLWAPSGLVIYWFVSNMWAIGQQYFTTWLIGPLKVAPVRAANERRMKSAGAGRSRGAEKN